MTAELFLLFTLFLSASSQASDKSAFDASLAERIIQQFVKIKKPEESKNWVYREERVLEKLTTGGTVLNTLRSIYEWRTQGDQREGRLLEVNGEPAAGPFIQEIPAADLSDWNFEKVAHRFDFKIVKFEKMQNRDVARIHFSPKKRQLRSKGRLEKIVSKLEGDLWMIVEEQQLIRAWAKIRQPVKFGGGVLGKVGKLAISYTQQQVNGQWVAESLQFEIDARELFSRTRFRERRVYSGFQEKSAGQ